ncbi:MAG TPA: PIN domain nuclease [Acidimicrobiia bacterium]|nr:PIN domain nuclease [Acidimicrobiia bacterium]
MIVVDTSVWIDFFRDTATWQVEHLDQMIADDESVALTDIVLTEILQGLPDDREARRVEHRLLAFDVLRLEGLDDFRRAASLYRQARAKGVTIRRTLDCLIASVCVRDGASVLHSDADFDHLAACTDLRVVARA